MLGCLFLYSQESNFENDTERPGMDINNFDLADADPQLCKIACDKSNDCQAWTYVKPGFQGEKARCWLKNAIPEAIPNDCCISGIKSEASMKKFDTFLKANVKSFIQLTEEKDIDRLGMDFDNFDLDSADVKLCVDKCRENQKCLSYTYVKPGVQGPNARCWLKYGVPAPIINTCCISGIKTGSKALPEIQSISPKEPDGASYVHQGEKFIIIGKNFSADKTKNKIGIRRFTTQEIQIPPQTEDFIAEITPSSASSTQLEALAPLNVAKDKYLVWVYVDGIGNSNAYPMWIAPVAPPPKAVPVITSIDPAVPGSKTYIHGKNFHPNVYVEWDLPQYFSAIYKYVNTSTIQTSTPSGLKPGKYLLRVEADGMKSDWFEVLLLEPKLLNIYWDLTDENGIPKNLIWGWQLIKKFSDVDYYPNIKQLVKDNDNPDDFAPYTDQPLFWKNGLWGCGPHVNWGAVTIEGILKWSSHSSPGSDDDYNFYLFPENGKGATTANGTTVQGIRGIQLEFDSDETIDHFHTPWWNAFHSAVDNNDSLAHKMADGKYAIVTGLWGLDCAHDCQSEMHPVWAMAIQTEKKDTWEEWAIFARNWGNEGYCGSGYWGQDVINIDFPKENNNYVYKLKLPWRENAESVYINDNFLVRKNISMSITPIVGDGVYIALYMPHWSEQDRINGILKLDWKFPESYSYQIQSEPFKAKILTYQAQILSPSFQDAVKKNPATKISEEEIIFQKLIKSLTPEQAQGFEFEIASIMQQKGMEVYDQIKIHPTKETQIPTTKELLAKIPKISVSENNEIKARSVELQNVLEKRNIDINIIKHKIKNVPLSSIEFQKSQQSYEEITTELDIDRPGMDYDNFDLPTADPTLCKQKCISDNKCKAYTYVKPGIQSDNARCWIKYGIPEPVKSPCCISGFKGKQQATPIPLPNPN